MGTTLIFTEAYIQLPRGRPAMQLIFNRPMASYQAVEFNSTVIQATASAVRLDNTGFGKFAFRFSPVGLQSLLMFLRQASPANHLKTVSLAKYNNFSFQCVHSMGATAEIFPKMMF